ncbi:NINE protein [Deinococcus soli (ex Cha et al. 2016)]|uniref:TM2 domain-containing protein n=2 Tax=Deinococcus soli (ex Cha et al. 2016) TaxID=1309411 RepID=A0AAE4BMI1_9DEIO|nr:NINE protein [Deinococcus soli (ex Cha et al. 2016)]MDR6218179.1 hypothetical protein [Deinococcus soli (ex Cha et al. 2016)]MDR6328919.1 hypothetical protein [Deinococcus soli (ex Cha et al. 2016)]MDR6751593.1 hypothetical protein [Deinococcus soli (ex Cha et al. 2016)]
MTDLPAPTARSASIDSTRLTAGLLALLLGGFGVHKFYLRYHTAAWLTVLLGVVMPAATALLLLSGAVRPGVGIPLLLVTLAGPGLLWIMALIEGLVYLSRTNEEFQDRYVRQQHPWL